MLALGIWSSLILSVLGAGCGTFNCQAPQLPVYYQSQPPQQVQIPQGFTYRYQLPTIPQQQPQAYHYYYPANSYQIPPQKVAVAPPVAAQPSVDETAESKDKTSSTYDDFEKELENLKAGTGATLAIKDNRIELEPNASSSVLKKEPSITYIREYPEYFGRVLPYRPFVSMPVACQQYAIQPQFTRPPIILPPPQPQPQLQAYVTAPPMILQKPLVPPPLNDCCGRCGAPCKFRSKHNVIALASKIFSAQFIPRRDGELEDEPKDPKCNSEKLKDIMNKYITRTVALSKRLVQKNAEHEIGGYFSVFCSTDDFSYVARSEMFCQVQKNDIICYAFKHN